MNEQTLLDDLRARAANDAAAFREKFPDDTPNERWIENSFTAALPLVRDNAGADVEPSEHAALFSAYAAEIARHLGGDTGRESTEAAVSGGSDQLQAPGPGENQVS
jgi:hypothetical protein